MIKILALKVMMHMCTRVKDRVKTSLQDTPDVGFLFAIIRHNFDVLQRCIKTGV